MSFWDMYFEDGNINTILAPPKKGKTNVAVDMCGKALNHGFDALSNIMFYDEDDIPEAKRLGWLDPHKKYILQPERFKTLPTASELILASIESKKNIVVVDEAGISASSYRSQSYSAIQMRFLGFTIRKLGSCLIVIAQSKSSVVPDLRQHLTTFESRIIKNRDNSRSMQIMKANHYFNTDKNDYDVEMIPYDTLHNIPPTRLAYDTRHPGGFKWDLDLQELYNTIAERKISSVKIRKQMPGIIRNMVAENKIDEYLKKKKFMRTGTVSQIFKVTTRTIRNWVDSGDLNAIKDDKNNLLFSRAEVIKKAVEMGIY